MIAVIDSGVANLTSVMAALHRLNAKAIVTTDADTIRNADHVILPGVGAAAPAMAQLKSKNLVEVIRNLTQPVMGICLGMQLLFERLSESNGVDGIGVLPGTVTRLPSSPRLPVPHMGWNSLTATQPQHALLKNVTSDSFVYFVHSFAAAVSDYTVATADYGLSFTAIAARNNFYGCQFHPERSSSVGSRILKNFLEI